ncbi:MAG TPA: hypothetical protein VJ694_04440 [Patescibacteria group bacterium]|nr:hypothetical protein [Patescibacteria group bacterium]
MPMLTQDDLKAIGTIVGEQIEAKVPPMIDALEERMNVKFDAVHEDIESLRSQMVTKSYLDDKLAHYVKKPF